jgi:hypothetical protein
MVSPSLVLFSFTSRYCKLETNCRFPGEKLVDEFDYDAKMVVSGAKKFFLARYQNDPCFRYQKAPNKIKPLGLARLSYENFVCSAFSFGMLLGILLGLSSGKDHERARFRTPKGQIAPLSTIHATATSSERKKI